MNLLRPRLTVAALAAVAVTAAACGGGAGSGATSTATGAAASSASVPGVTADSILIGGHTPLTGPAAPGYDEIAPSAKAFFDYVNAHGGVYGRKIHYTYLDDGYNPATTSTVVKQLVLQDHVFAIFNGLGTPTHSAVVDYLNQNKVPDIFVASGCSCWNEPKTRPWTFGWQPDYILEGKILGQYIEQHYKGKKVGYLLQSDDFGTDGGKGLDMYVPKSQVVSRQTYVSGTQTLTAQMEALKAAGVQVLASFSVPIYTAIAELTGAQIGFTPQYVVSNVGSDAPTLAGLITAVGKGKAPTSLINGMVSDTYLPALNDTSNSWVTLFRKIQSGDPAIAKFPYDGNVEYGMAAAYTFVQALQAAGKNLTRAGLVHAIENSHFSGPGLVPFRFSPTVHAGYSGVQVTQIQNGVAVPQGKVLVTGDGSSPITPYTGGQPQAPANGVPTG